MNQMKLHQWRNNLNSAVVAIAFIMAGILILGRNAGWISPYIVSVLVSWQMILVVIGIMCLIKRNYTIGFVFISLGVFLMFPIRQLWPLLLISLGIVILIKTRNKDNNWLFQHQYAGWRNRQHDRTDKTTDHYDTKYSMEDGFIVSDVAFSSARHIVLEHVFKGADLNIIFGSLVIDLRRTSLNAPQTLIRLNAMFSGVEIFVPSTWNVVVEADTVLSGLNDKRFLSQPTNKEHKLVIQGNVKFSGIEIKC